MIFIDTKEEARMKGIRDLAHYVGGERFCERPAMGRIEMEGGS